MNEEIDHAKPIGANMQATIEAAIDLCVSPDAPKTIYPSVEGDMRTPEQQAQAAREKRYFLICPPLYRETDPARIPDQESLARVMAWQAVLPDFRLNPHGMLLVGEPGSGKTRAAWLKIKRVIMKNRCTVKAFDGIGWGLAVSSHLGDSETAEDWIEECCKVQVLFIDDCFKARMTEAQEFAIFGVLDRRAAWKKPTIVTMNSSGAAIAGRTAKFAGEGERFGAIMRRMTEFADVIQFKIPERRIEAKIAGVKA